MFIGSGKHGFIVNIVFLFIVFFLGACSNIAVYNEYVYRELVSLKIDTKDFYEQAKDIVESTPKNIKSEDLKSKMMAEAVNLKTDYRKILIRLKKVTEYVGRIPKNEESHRQLLVVIDPKKTLVPFFYLDWSRGFISSRGEIRNRKNMLNWIGTHIDRIVKAFDMTLDLESRKIKNDDA